MVLILCIYYISVCNTGQVLDIREEITFAKAMLVSSYVHVFLLLMA